jgi:hypothetical protein
MIKKLGIIVLATSMLLAVVFVLSLVLYGVFTRPVDVSTITRFSDLPPLDKARLRELNYSLNGMGNFLSNTAYDDCEGADVANRITPNSPETWTGYVMYRADGQTSFPLEGATVRVYSRDLRETRTDSDGRFEFENFSIGQCGTHFILISHPICDSVVLEFVDLLGSRHHRTPASKTYELDCSTNS